MQKWMKTLVECGGEWCFGCDGSSVVLLWHPLHCRWDLAPSNTCLLGFLHFIEFCAARMPNSTLCPSRNLHQNVVKLIKCGTVQRYEWDDCTMGCPSFWNVDSRRPKSGFLPLDYIFPFRKNTPFAPNLNQKKPTSLHFMKTNRTGSQVSDTCYGCLSGFATSAKNLPHGHQFFWL